MLFESSLRSVNGDTISLRNGTCMESKLGAIFGREILLIVHARKKIVGKLGQDSANWTVSGVVLLGFNSLKFVISDTHVILFLGVSFSSKS